MDMIRDQARNNGPRAALAALGAWIAKVPKEIIIRTYVRTYVQRVWGLGSGVWGQEFGAPQRFVRTYVRTHSVRHVPPWVLQEILETQRPVYVRTYVRT